MVTFINESTKSLESIFNEFDMSIAEAYNECEYTALSERYNYICENGCAIPINEAEEKKESLLRKLINSLVDGLTRLKDKLVRWCRSHYEGSRLQTVVSKIKAKFSSGKKNIESASTPEEAKTASKDASEEMKKETETSDIEIPKKYENVSFSSFDNKLFWKAIKEKDFIRLKVNAVSTIRNDPVFAKNELSTILSIFDNTVPEIFEDEVHLEYEDRLDKKDWDENYFSDLTYYLQKNFAKSRIPLIKKVGRMVYK